MDHLKLCSVSDSKALLFEGQALMADPIHGYIPFTVPIEADQGTSEKDLIDSSWMQRLRYISQLQSARWVFPTAEHSRFVHSLGAMHIAGRFATHLYPSLKEVVPDVPSSAFIEALLRVSVLLHDIGHGPFCHFFDHNYLDTFHLSHEKLGQEIIRRELNGLIQGIRRSPGGVFAPGENLDPEHVAFLIHKDPSYQTPLEYPRWLVMLKPLFSGIFTADNLDYVLRDAFMCGVSTGPIDLDRLIHYSFFSKQGLTLHQAGLPALTMFLNARAYLYFNVYYHRTTRALDTHMKDIFRATIKEVFPCNPLDCLEDYADLSDWSLLIEVKSWKASSLPSRRALFKEWEKIWGRDVKWKMACDTTLSTRGSASAASGEKAGTEQTISPNLLAKRIKALLPKKLQNLHFRVDIASKDQRPDNPMEMGERQIYIFNPSTGSISKEALSEFIDVVPARVVRCRIYALDHEHDALLSELAEKALEGIEE